MKIKFKKRKESLLDTVFLKLEYMSGDADAYEYEEVSFGEHIKFSNYEEHLEEIQKIVEQYKLISKFTDCNDKLSLEDERDAYEYIKENYSEELADLYENVPGDSTCDSQRTAHLRRIILCGYNDIGEYFESYL